MQRRRTSISTFLNRQLQANCTRCLAPRWAFLSHEALACPAVPHLGDPRLSPDRLFPEPTRRAHLGSPWSRARGHSLPFASEFDGTDVPSRVPSLLACTWAYARSPPAPGDVIVFWAPNDPGTPYVKRIVGIGGDTVQFADGALVRNGVEQHEPYLMPGATRGDDHRSSVPQGHVFVAGDNRSNSLDSRHFGPVPNHAIVGRICGRL